MENSKQPAYPLPITDCNDGGIYNTGEQTAGEGIGITKREYFAGLAMNGYISAGSTGMPDKYDIANYAISAADELLKQLEKSRDADH